MSDLILKRPNQKKTSAAGPSRRLSLSHVVLIASGMVLMFLLESLFWPGRGLAWHLHAAPGKNHAALAASVSNTPPWGRLEYTPIALERPEEYFTNDFAGKVPTVWVFRNQTPAQLTSLLAGLDFPEVARAYLADTSHWEKLSQAYRILPPPEVVLSLSPETRRRLYEILGRSPDNPLHATPFRFRKDGFDEWFAECGLNREKVELVRRLTYTQQDNLCFADATTFSQISTPEETKCLVKTLWRVSTFMIKLRVDENTDVDQLLNYWGRLGSARAYKPLLESMSRVPGGSSANLSFFLPPFARLRLYTYPNPRDPNVTHEDCFWSAMNFFNSEPDNGFFDPEYIQKVLRSDYARVRDGSQQYGDVLMLLGRENKALHMCVYVADDVIFTKNGMNTQQPWVLMKLPEMLGEYELEKPFVINVYRRTKPAPITSTHEFSSAARTL